MSKLIKKKLGMNYTVATLTDDAFLSSFHGGDLIVHTMHD